MLGIDDGFQDDERDYVGKKNVGGPIGCGGWN